MSRSILTLRSDAFEGAGSPAFFLMHVIRIPREEAMMRETFGDAYDAYAARTGQVFPDLKRRAQWSKPREHS
ncbi:MAG: hypothetical protein GC196_14865 [Hyphomonas sp.]|nr:hypothetical protein [Hyphomonas sp.]